jgi:uncharacterized protein (TIGR00369 family)
MTVQSMLTIPADFQPHFRKSPVTDPWEPLYSCRRLEGVDLLFEVRLPHCNARGMLHGGVLAALCDNAMGLSLATVLNDPDRSLVTVHLALDYLGSAKVGDCVLIEPRVIRAGSSLGFCDAMVKAADRPIVRANAVFSMRAGAHKP